MNGFSNDNTKNLFYLALVFFSNFLRDEVKDFFLLCSFPFHVAFAKDHNFRKSKGYWFDKTCFFFIYTSFFVIKIKLTNEQNPIDTREKVVFFILGKIRRQKSKRRIKSLDQKSGPKVGSKGSCFLFPWKKKLFHSKQRHIF